MTTNMRKRSRGLGTKETDEQKTKWWHFPGMSDIETENNSKAMSYSFARLVRLRIPGGQLHDLLLNLWTVAGQSMHAVKNVKFCKNNFWSRQLYIVWNYWQTEKYANDASYTYLPSYTLMFVANCVDVFLGLQLMHGTRLSAVCFNEQRMRQRLLPEWEAWKRWNCPQNCKILNGQSSASFSFIFILQTMTQFHNKWKWK